MPKVTQKGTGKRGGARPGAGKKKTLKNHSEAVKKNYQLAAAKILAETGMTVEEHFLRAAIDKDMHPGSRAAFAKLYNEALLVKETKSTVQTTEKPAVYLPEILPKPKTLQEETQQQAVH